MRVLLKKKNILLPQLVIPVFLLILIFSCKKEDDFITDPSAKLEFSSDSVSFDTVFTTVGSVTKQLKVYNRNNKTIKISNISIKNGLASLFRMNVDGIPGTSVNDIEINADDSLFIFIKVTVDPNDETSPFVVSDQIIFDINNNQQDVDLVAWGQNANYIIADTYVKGLPPYKIVAHEFSDTAWTNEKPFLIYGYAVVDSNAILRIQQGTKIHFHTNGGLWIYKGGALKVNGTIEEPVYFQGDRIGSDYSETGGQWDRIWINEGSIDNEINYAVIKNAFIGLQAETLQEQMGNELIIKNTVIENMTGMGLFTRYYNISAENLVVANCEAYGVALTLGGDYSFKQCTFANYWNQSIRQTPNLFMNNFYIDTNDVSHPFDLDVYFGNCIIYGRNDNEIDFDKDGGAEFSYMFDHSLLKTGMDITNPEHYISCIKNEDALFVNHELNNYELDSLSPAINAGSMEIALEVPFDIKGIDRTENPDLGAYEFIPGNPASRFPF